MRSRGGVVAVALVGALALSGGAAGAGGDEETLTVLAAASLTETFTELAEEFEAEHPGVRVRLAFDSSATLAQQALEGAPADVLATADALEAATERVVALELDDLLRNVGR